MSCVPCILVLTTEMLVLEGVRFSEAPRQEARLLALMNGNKSRRVNHVFLEVEGVSGTQHCACPEMSKEEFSPLMQARREAFDHFPAGA